ncbi:MAG: ATP-binding cassette domain-containing protein [Sandaracinaceae bacterium]|nr:ATP-binding cassette domain-containing protein [Sandaracinaceae bacterium]
MSEVLYEVRGIAKSFGDRPILEHVDLDIRRAEFLCWIGESGTGKSLLAKILLGLVPTDRGTIRFDGEDVTRFRERDWLTIRRRVGVLLQSSGLFDSVNVFENVAYGLKEQQLLPLDGMKERVAQSLAQVGLPGIETMMPGELSGGMRKRVALARAIAMRPEVLFYDGPTEGLDPVNVARVNRLLLRLRDQLGITTIVITHQMETAFGAADRVLLMADGRVALEGTPRSLWGSSEPTLQPFLRIARDVLSAPRGA